MLAGVGRRVFAAGDSPPQRYAESITEPDMWEEPRPPWSAAAGDESLAAVVAISEELGPIDDPSSEPAVFDELGGRTINEHVAAGGRGSDLARKSLEKTRAEASAEADPSGEADP